jgi:hypothetical protein
MCGIDRWLMVCGGFVCAGDFGHEDCDQCQGEDCGGGVYAEFHAIGLLKGTWVGVCRVCDVICLQEPSKSNLVR